MKSLFAKRVKSTKCNFEKIDILYHDYLTSFQFVFILCDESRHLLEINYMVVWNEWVIFFLNSFFTSKMQLDLTRFASKHC